MNWYRVFIVQTTTLTPSLHQIFNEYGKLPTKSSLELKDNFKYVTNK